MDKTKYIAEHLDPMDTVAGWATGEAFAAAVIDNADGPLAVGRDDLIAYWAEAHASEASTLRPTADQIVALYERADLYQDAMVAWIVFQAARDADYGDGPRFGNGRCPYSIRRIQRMAERRDAWHEANRLNPDAYADAAVRAATIIAEIMTDEQMTVAEVASTYGKSEQTVYTAISDGKLPASKSGGIIRIRRSDAEARWGSKS